MEKTELKLGLQPFWFWNGDMNRQPDSGNEGKGNPRIYDSSQTGYGSALYVKRVF